MGKPELDNLVRIGKLKPEAPARAEFDGLVDSARKRLKDARNAGLSPESRFDLAYNAAHAFALAALRQNGYRSENRYVVFQALVHTIRNGGDEGAVARATDQPSRTAREVNSRWCFLPPPEYVVRTINLCAD